MGLNIKEITEYLKERQIVNIDSMYRCRTLGFTDRKECTQYLGSVGYSFPTSKVATPLSIPLQQLTDNKTSILVKDLEKSSTKDYFKPKDKQLLITSYVVRTSVHKLLWQNLRLYADKLNADIVVIPVKYKFEALQKAIVTNDENYIDPLVAEYLDWERFTHGNYEVFADVQLNPTAVNPLSALRSCWKTNSIYAHPTQNMITGANSVNLDSPVIWCTGTVSQIPVGHKLAEQKASYHQRYGFLITDGYDIRNVHANKNGSFHDVTTYVSTTSSGGSVLTPSNPVAMVWGDLHIGNHDPAALEWAMNITSQLNPNLVTLHDVFDGSSINPHSTTLCQRNAIYSTLTEEISDNHRLLSDILNYFKKNGCTSKLAIADSNHHDFLSRYFENTSPNLLSLDDRQVMSEWLMGGYKQMFKEVNHLDYDHTVENVFVGRHGHKGVNGAKGSLTGDFNSGQRQIAGHVHSPGIMGLAERVGCLCKLSQGYNSNSLSSWAHSIAAIYPGGNTQHYVRR